MKLRFAISIFIIAVFGAGLAACGGGSVSTGGGSGTGGTGGANSSLVIQAPQTAHAPGFQGGTREDSRLASRISEFLISSALAQSGEEVYLLDESGDLVATGTTDGSGQVIFPVSSGSYFICIGEADLDNGTCTAETQDVGDNEVVVVTLEVEGETDTDPGVLMISSVSVERAEDNIVAFQDPDNANKTLVCHKAGPFKQFTISVGTPAALTGHMAHGDTLGPCPDETEVSEDDASDDFSDADSSGGRPDQAGPPQGIGNGQNG
ncbi:MAG: hypothetical protein U5R46_19575 [Gammaproteobacteria bacterium]|nr:hypothetical protein [Gammaproteobacteria bacterium]